MELRPRALSVADGSVPATAMDPATETVHEPEPLFGLAPDPS